MPLITWSKELSVGIESIDTQHKELISIINTLNDAMDLDDPRDIFKKSFADLTQYTKTHFAYEEELFEQYGYQESIEHKRQHDELIVQLLELKDRFDHYQIDMTEQVMQFLKDWLTFHIQKSDKEYSQFLVKLGVK